MINSIDRDILGSSGSAALGWEPMHPGSPTSAGVAVVGVDSCVGQCFSVAREQSPNNCSGFSPGTSQCETPRLKPQKRKMRLLRGLKASPPDESGGSHRNVLAPKCGGSRP